MPEVWSCLGPFEEMAIVTVPETAVHKDYGAPASENQIGRARERTLVKSEPVPESVKAGTDCKFWFCVPAPDGLHHPTADLGRYDISQVGAGSVLWWLGLRTAHQGQLSG